jgi:hypothetical protein
MTEASTISSVLTVTRVSAVEYPNSSQSRVSFTRYLCRRGTECACGKGMMYDVTVARVRVRVRLCDATDTDLKKNGSAGGKSTSSGAHRGMPHCSYVSSSASVAISFRYVAIFPLGGGCGVRRPVRARANRVPTLPYPSQRKKGRRSEPFRLKSCPRPYSIGRDGRSWGGRPAGGGWPGATLAFKFIEICAKVLSVSHLFI